MASISYIICFVMLAFAFVVGAQNYTIPSTYSVVVSTNSDELGFTYAFKEYYDSGVNLWRIDINGTNNIFNLTNNIMKTISGSDCTFIKMISNSTSGLPLEPSTLRLEEDLVGATYVGTTTIRDRNAFHYIKKFDWEINGTIWNITDDFYFSAENGLPLRAVTSLYNISSNATDTPTFTVYSDWVNWITESEPNTFDTPNSCHENTDNSTIFDNLYHKRNSTFTHTRLPDDAPFPTLASTFSAVIEGKFNTVDGEMVISFSENVETLGAEWKYNSGLNIERVDLLLDSSDVTRSEIYDYERKIVYYSYPHLFCFFDLIDDVNDLSIMSKGVGTVHQLFVPSATSPLVNFNTSTAKYTGQNRVRGVLADTWTFSNVSLTTSTAVYNFDTYVYFFPQGWRFFGRALTASVVPMRIINNGTVTVGNTTTPYLGEWDIFQYVDNTPDNTQWSNATSLDGDCPLDPTPKNLTIPEKYSVFVSFNNATAGVTFAYEEISDSEAGLTRIFMYEGEQFILDFEEDQMYRFNPYNKSSVCSKFEYDDDTGFFYPLYLLIDFFKSEFFEPAGQTTEVRGIICNYFTYKLDSEIKIFIDAYTSLLLRIIVRDLVIDYVDWNTANLNNTVFTKPINCDTQSDRYMPQINYNNSKPDNETMPSLPTQFYVVVEGNSPIFEGLYTQLEWYYDSVAKQERVNTLTQSGTSRTYNFSALPGVVYEKPGDCDETPVDPESNVEASFGSGFLHDIFDPEFVYKSISGPLPTPAYGGRVMLRSIIPASKWTYTNITSVINDTTYVYDASIYFYPEGWNFPGRHITNQRVPLRVETSGQLTKGDITSAFNEIWNLFEFHPRAPLASSFEPCVDSLIPLPYNAPNTLSSSSSTSSTSTVTTISASTTTGEPVKTNGHGLSGGVTAIIVIVIVVAVAGAIIGVILVIRKRGGISAPGGNRENRTFEHIREDETF